MITGLKEVRHWHCSYLKAGKEPDESLNVVGTWRVQARRKHEIALIVGKRDRSCRML